MKKLLYITPHLSTGGAPQYLLKKIDLLKNNYDLYLVEYNDIGGTAFVVQKNKIFQIIPSEKRLTLNNSKEDLLAFIEKIKPDIIHLEEIPEMFMDGNIAEKIYSPDRKYTIFETSHDSSQNSRNKKFLPDKFLFVSNWQIDQYIDVDVPSILVEYPIEYREERNRELACSSLGIDPTKKHIINVGLFTPRKNQAEFFEYARALPQYEFHCIGNQADNFKNYWEPLMSSKPANLTVWGERNDVDLFYQAADLFLFTSKGTSTDKETMPLVIREALSWKLPILIYNLEVYQNYFDSYPVYYLKSMDKNINQIKEVLSEPLVITADDFHVNFEGENRINVLYNKKDRLDCRIVVKEKFSNAPWYWLDATFENFNRWWIIPNKGFSIADSWVQVLTLDFYDRNKNLLFSKDVDIKPTGITPNIQLELKNPFDCLFHNYTEMFVEKKYDFLFENKLNTVLDIGANAGVFSKLLLENQVESVYAFEPNDTALINLKYLEEQNPRLKVIPKAVHTAEENLKFFIAPDNTTIGSTNKDHITAHGYKVEEVVVPTITLKRFVQQENLTNIDLIKIDIEGAEYDLIESLEDEIFEAVDRFMIEWHSNVDGRLEKLVNTLLSKNYYIERVFNQSTGEDLTKTYANEPVGTLVAIKNKLKNPATKEPNPIIIVDAFFHDKNALTQLTKYLSFIKKLDMPLMLVTNSNFDSSLVDSFDYILYDSNNRLFKKEYKDQGIVNFWYANEEHKFYITEKNKQPHGLSVLSNLYRSTNLAKSLGYTHFYRIEYDCFIEDLKAVKKIVNEVYIQNKKGYGYLNEDKYLSFHMMYMELDYFTQIFPQINNEEDYGKAIAKLTKRDWLSAEEFVAKLLKKSDNGIDSIILKDAPLMFTDFGESLWNTVTTPVESSLIKNGSVALPFQISNDTSKAALITWNISTEEPRKAYYKVTAPGKETQKFFHRIAGINDYRIDYIPLDSEPTQIEVTYDGNVTTYSLTSTNVNELKTSYESTKQSINYTNTAPKFVASHLLTRITDDREIKSIKSIIALTDLDVKYNPNVNTPYTSVPPSLNCARPQDIASEPGFMKLAPGHYGAFKAHTDAILNCTPKENTGYLFFECDAVLIVPPEEFLEKVKQAYTLCLKNDYDFFSFGPVYKYDHVYDDHIASNSFYEATAYIIPGEKIQNIQNAIKNTSWDAFDLWTTNIYNRRPIGHFPEYLALQAKGFSFIEKVYRDKNFLNIDMV